ncbi:hypothetical protein I4N56_003615 [Pseudomonas mohnii]|uniref:hypothetical protein n=1 Tax=Pseudomonas mohnii TaxID=395600 RepID=UPI0018C571BB|nr:hypothetical protein [Pseudomonas mohnii]MBH8610133.1 hypothetical protein [Pseudomonas mohnii]
MSEAGDELNDAGLDLSNEFHEGDVVMIENDDSQPYTLIKYDVEFSVWIAQAGGTGVVVRVRREEVLELPKDELTTLHKKLFAGKAELEHRPASEAHVLAETYTYEQEKTAKDREDILKELEAGTIKTLEEARLKMGLEKTAFKDVRRKYARDPHWRSLVPKPPGRKAGSHEQDQALIKLYMEAFQEKYKNYGASAAAVYGEFEDLCNRDGLIPFSQSTGYRIFIKIDQKIKDKKSKGADYANKKYNPYPSSFELPGPFSRVQVDSTVADIIIIDLDTKKVLGRPYLTVVEDEFTGGIMAVYVSFSPPSRAVIAAALYQSFTSKNAMLADLGIREDAWIITGPAACYLVDKGSEHDNKHFRSTCRKFNIKYEYRRRPQTGGAVESAIYLFNTLFVQLLDGTTGSSPRHDKDFDPEGKARYDLMTFNRLVQLEAIRLNDMVRERDNLSPNERFIRWYNDNEYGAKVPPVMNDPLGFMLNMLPGGRPLVRREGILYKGVLYDHGPVRHLVERGVHVSVRQNPLDLHVLYVLHDESWYKVRALKPSRVPKTETERKAIKRSRDRAGTVGEDGRTARAAISQIISENPTDAKAVARARASLEHAEQQGLIPTDEPEQAKESVETHRYAHVQPFKGDEDK